MFEADFRIFDFDVAHEGVRDRAFGVTVPQSSSQSSQSSQSGDLFRLGFRLRMTGG